MKLAEVALSFQQRQLVKAILLVNALALCLGLLFGLFQFQGENTRSGIEWQSSELSVIPNPDEDYSQVINTPHWFADAASQLAQAEDLAKKNLEGTPEAFKLIGIQHKQQKNLALFLPQNANSAAAVKTLSEQDALVGDWVVEKITTGSVILRAQNASADTQTKEIFLYSQNAK